MAKRKQKKWDPLKAHKSAARKAHFEAGGSVRMWRGGAKTFKDERKEALRKKCRERVDPQTP